MEGERKQCKAIYLAVLNRNNFKGVTSLPCQSASFCYHPFSSSLVFLSRSWGDDLSQAAAFSPVLSLHVEASKELVASITNPFDI